MESNKRRGRVDLFISNKKLRGDCMDVAQMMRELGINCNITANKSVILDEKVNRWIIENGCKIIIPNIELDELEGKLWKPMQRKHNLGCAHLDISGIFSGCILDYLNNNNE